jgi:cation transporter-like permease
MTLDDASSDLIMRYSQELWVLTIVFFLVGDLVTSALGIAAGGVVEAGPLGAPIVRRYGIPGMITLKIGVLTLSYAAWRLVPDPDRIGIPLGLATVGILVTFWNGLILLFTHS